MGRRTVIEGRLTRLERFTHPGRGLHGVVDGLGATAGCYRVHLDDQQEPVGWIHASKVLNRVATGEDVRVWLAPGDDRIRRIRPAGRRLRWYQF